MTAVDYHHQTTIITGASAGLGVEFAHQLAARGSNVVLVARRRERLEALAAEIREKYGVVATSITLDLSRPGVGATLAAEVDRLGIAVTGLVNNAGFGTYGPFHESDRSRIAEEISVNVANLIDVTGAFILRLRAAGVGILVNVASTAAYQPIPNMAVYGATKAFVLNFTEALWYESLGTGLRVIALSPGATRTEFFDVVGTEDAKAGNYQTPKQVIDTVLRALDRRAPGPSVVSGAANRISAAGHRFLSRRGMVKMSAAVMRPSHP